MTVFPLHDKGHSYSCLGVSFQAYFKNAGKCSKRNNNINRTVGPKSKPNWV